MDDNLKFGACQVDGILPPQRSLISMIKPPKDVVNTIWIAMYERRHGVNLHGSEKITWRHQVDSGP